MVDSWWVVAFFALSRWFVVYCQLFMVTLHNCYQVLCKWLADVSRIRFHSQNTSTSGILANHE